MEIVYSLEGQVSITVEGVEMTIAAGESAVFHADRPHRYAAAGKHLARFVMVVVEPLAVPRSPAKRARASSRQEAEGERQKAEGKRQTAKG